MADSAGTRMDRVAADRGPVSFLRQPLRAGADRHALAWRADADRRCGIHRCMVDPRLGCIEAVKRGQELAVERVRRPMRRSLTGPMPVITHRSQYRSFDPLQCHRHAAMPTSSMRTGRRGEKMWATNCSELTVGFLSHLLVLSPRHGIC